MNVLFFGAKLAIIFLTAKYLACYLKYFFSSFYMHNNAQQGPRQTARPLCVDGSADCYIPPPEVDVPPASEALRPPTISSLVMLRAVFFTELLRLPKR